MKIWEYGSWFGGYDKYFISKLTDADSENSETQVWLKFTESCQNISAVDKKEPY
ncbi:hypothetical protein KO529_00685 [Arenibacter algicola]|uniref:hypothetical protein n=1 Tax=Arenibacter algicola TaxID=616991 RepID=UPI001C067F0E|nr:hypothetical protein [Arenibacter algicola]MBU2903282.1 hypothetical protein [Arenibacter algicola]